MAKWIRVIDNDLTWRRDQLEAQGYIKDEADWQSFIDYMCDAAVSYFEDTTLEEE